MRLTRGAGAANGALGGDRPQAAAYWFPFHVGPADKVAKWGMFTLAYYRDHLLPDPRSGVMGARYMHVSRTTDDAPPEGLVRKLAHKRAALPRPPRRAHATRRGAARRGRPGAPRPT